VGKKYLIEAMDKSVIAFVNPEHCYKTEGSDPIIVTEVKEYVEPDLKAIREEYYDHGFKDANTRCDDCAAVLRAYNKGYKEAADNIEESCDNCVRISAIWDAVKKVVLAGKGYYSSTELDEIFGTSVPRSILEMGPEKVLKLMKNYEKRKAETPHTGDEVKVLPQGDTAVFICHDSGALNQLLYPDGKVYNKTNDLVKTGRHFDELSGIITQIGKDGGET